MVVGIIILHIQYIVYLFYFHLKFPGISGKIRNGIQYIVYIKIFLFLFFSYYNIFLWEYIECPHSIFEGIELLEVLRIGNIMTPINVIEC